jgi:hypothetical protein
MKNIITILALIALIPAANAKQPRKLRGLKTDECRTTYSDGAGYDTICRHPSGFMTLTITDIGNGQMQGNVTVDIINQ